MELTEIDQMSNPKSSKVLTTHTIITSKQYLDGIREQDMEALRARSQSLPDPRFLLNNVFTVANSIGQSVTSLVRGKTFNTQGAEDFSNSVGSFVTTNIRNIMKPYIDLVDKLMQDKRDLEQQNTNLEAKVAALQAKLARGYSISERDDTEQENSELKAKINKLDTVVRLQDPARQVWSRRSSPVHRTSKTTEGPWPCGRANH